MFPRNVSDSLPGQPNLIHDVDTFLDWLSPRFPKVFGNLTVKFKILPDGTGTGPLCGQSSDASGVSVAAVLVVAAFGFLL